MTINIEVKERRFVQHLLVCWRVFAPDGVPPSRRRIREAEVSGTPGAADPRLPEFG